MEEEEVLDGMKIRSITGAVMRRSPVLKGSFQMAVTPVIVL